MPEVSASFEPRASAVTVPTGGTLTEPGERKSAACGA